MCWNGLQKDSVNREIKCEVELEKEKQNQK